MLRNIVVGFIYIYFMLTVIDCTLVQMRVVKDTANYGFAGNNLLDNENSNKLVPSVKASNFSGPELLERLIGKCYNSTEERYRYLFCPFQNITQYEVSARWNAYQGILGIWSHWEIENNTFSFMVYKNGDQCGDIERAVKISFQCGSKEELLNVTEPNKCQYFAIFNTRYVCHEDALLVYPRLNKHLRDEWDQLLSELHFGDITKKGYDVGLQNIFQKAGLAEIPKNKSSNKAVTVSQTQDGKFIDLLTCNREYKKLNDEISRLNLEVETLKLMIDLGKMENRTSKPHR